MVVIVPDVKPKKAYPYLISTVAAVGGFLFGYDLMIIASALIFLKKQFALNAFEVGFAATCALIGCALGPVLGGGLADRLGRRKTLMVAAVLFAVSTIGTSLPQTIGQFYVFRIIGGLGVGLAAVVSPMYIAEIAPPRMRGTLVTLNQLAIVSGCLISVIVCYFLSFSGSWRWMFASVGAPVIFLVAGLLFVPESPRWLAQKDRSKEAFNVLASIDGSEHAQSEMAEIEESLKLETGKFSELFQPGIRTALIIAIAIQISTQITGVSTLILYAPIILQDAGFAKASDAIRQAIYLNAWSFVCTLIVMAFLDRIGRRPILLVGTAGMAAGLAVMGLVFKANMAGLPVVLILFATLTFYWLSLAPLSWLITSEIFPTRIRGRAMSAATFVMWASAFTTSQLFPPMVDYFKKAFGSPAIMFWIFACVTVASFLFCLRMVPETKGKTLEQISRRWTKGI